MTSRSWTITVPAPGGKVMGANHDHRTHYRKVSSHRQAAKAHAALVVLEAGIPRLERIKVEPVVHLERWQATDPQNLPSGSTLKAMVDGLADEWHGCTRQCARLPGGCPLKGTLVRRGIVADDRFEHMEVVMPRLAPLGPKGSVARVVFTITEVAPSVGGDAGA